MKLIITTFLLLLSIASLAEEQSSTSEFIGYQACTDCHQEEVKQWQSSDHNQAMQHVNRSTVLGDFNQVTFENYGLISTFFTKRNEDKTEFWVNTDGPDGKLHDYEIKYTFGVYPLQQYLIEFPGGRLQALDIAWDSHQRARWTTLVSFTSR